MGINLINFNFHIKCFAFLSGNLLASWFLAVGFLYSGLVKFSPSGMDAVFFLVKSFLVSMTVFCTVFVTSCFFSGKSSKPLSESRIEIIAASKLSIIFLLLTVFALVALNLKNFGLPPLFGSFGFATQNYLEYGEYKGLLFPASGLLVLFGSAVGFRSLGILSVSIGVGILVSYFARGPLLFYLYQAVGFQFIRIFFCGEKNRTDKIFIALLILILSVILMKFLGEARTGHENFVKFMPISESGMSVSPYLLWIGSYFATPLLNYVNIQSCTENGFGFLQNALPVFAQPKFSFLNECINLSLPVDNAHFYLFYWYAAIGFAGVVLINAIYAIVANLSKNNIASFSIVASILFFSFFSDFVIMFSTLAEFALLFICLRLGNTFAKPIKIDQ